MNISEIINNTLHFSMAIGLFFFVILAVKAFMRDYKHRIISKANLIERVSDLEDEVFKLKNQIKKIKNEK